jgi:hypothetical protein
MEKSNPVKASKQESSQNYKTLIGDIIDLELSAPSHTILNESKPVERRQNRTKSHKHQNLSVKCALNIDRDEEAEEDYEGRNDYDLSSTCLNLLNKPSPSGITTA